MAVYQPKDHTHLIGTTGFSETLLRNHFTLYEGYVTNTNKLLELLKTKEVGTPEYAELQRRLGWEWNGMRLHEFYFGNMTKETAPLGEGAFQQKLGEEYGSAEEWRKDFMGVGSLRGIGWVVLTHDPATGKLFNVWINEHDTGHLSGTQPLLIMDVFEHAFMIDYGTKRADYLEAFFTAVDWKKIEARYQTAKEGKIIQS